MRFLIVGIGGSMGRRRVRNLRALGVAPDQITGVEPQEARRQAVFRESGVESVASLADAPAYDAMLVTTPPASHGSAIRRALADGKPFYAEVATADDGLRDALHAPPGQVCAACCSYRFNPPVAALRAVVQTGRIGRVVAYRHHLGQYLPDWHPEEDYRDVYFSEKETSAVREMTVYELGWVSEIVGGLPCRAVGLAAHLSSLDMAADDFLSATVEHGNGVVGGLVVEALSRTPSVRDIRIMGDEGTLEWRFPNDFVSLFPRTREDPEIVRAEMGRPVDGYISPEYMYVLEMQAFLAAARGEAAWPYPIAHELRCLDILRQIEACAALKH